MYLSTISEVAKEAGVSIATVSRVVNDNGMVSRETEERVKAAIAKLDYRPNVWGRSLRKGESRMLLILVPNVSNPYYAQIISGIEDVARQAGYNIMLCITNVEPQRRREYFSLLQNGRADGAVLIDTTANDPDTAQVARDYPIVQCCEYCPQDGLSHVSIDNVRAARDVMRYLYRLGHRRIGFIGSTNRFISTDQRQEGYRSVLSMAGLPVQEEYLAYADNDYSFLSGMQAAHHLLELPRRPTALFCISDVLALGAVRAAEERGLRVPNDLTVIGFDDVEYATMFRPQLTTVSQPCYELGRVSGELLLEQMSGGARNTVRFLPHQLIMRDSAAPCAVES